MTVETSPVNSGDTLFLGRDKVELFVHPGASKTDEDLAAVQELGGFAEFATKHLEITYLPKRFLLREVSDPAEFQRRYRRPLPWLLNGTIRVGVKEIRAYFDDYRQMVAAPSIE